MNTFIHVLFINPVFLTYTQKIQFTSSEYLKINKQDYTV